VLVLAYFFPPLGGAGVQRTTKFVKYLPAAGWTPTVVTTRGRWYPARDESLAADVPPGVRVIQARELAVPRSLSALLERFLLAPLARLLRWPDEMSGWVPGATRAALREIRRERPDVIFTTSAPYSAHLVGLLLHRRTGIPWVADFRDEWTENPEAGRQPRIYRAASRLLERLVLRHATRVTVTTDDARLADAVVADAKRTTITNGVDPDDIAGTGGRGGGERFRLSFVGTLYGGRDCAPVFAALRRLAERGAVDPSRAEFRVVGNVWLPAPPDAGPVPVVQAGYVDHPRAVREMAEADVLVVYLPSESRAIVGKLFEYLAAGPPVLTVAHPSNAGARLAAEFGSGPVVEPGDSAEIEAALEDLYGRWLRGDLHRGEDERRAEALRRFSRERLTRDLARVLAQAADGDA
jgi:glycosyltransferase involved in cell wall biosynthesis